MIDAPKTLEEAKNYKYNEWAGNPGGVSYSEEYCAYEIWQNMLTYQCSRKPQYGSDNLYCKQHARMIEDTIQKVA